MTTPLPRRVGVVGAGYVGLATMAMLFDLGYEVSVLDSDQQRIAALAQGTPPIQEPGLTKALEDGLKRGVVRFSSDAGEALSGCNVVFVCVGTPETSDGSADLSAVTNVLGNVERHASEAIAVIKSSVPPGTTDSLQSKFSALSLAVNPEFLRQGSAIRDAISPTRVVVGTAHRDALDAMRAIYAPMADRGVPQMFTTFATAELIKYASNSFLAVKVAFMNEIADLCEVSGASVAEVKTGMGLDPRIGDQFLQPGPGFGGSCLPKDTSALTYAARRARRPLAVVEAAINANRRRRASLGERVIAAAGSGPVRVAGVLGMAFKAATDDIRESPAVDLVDGLVERAVVVSVFDPAVRTWTPAVSSARVASSAVEVFNNADVVAVATEWPEFAEIDFEDAASRMAGNTIVDLRGLLDRQRVESAGLRLVSIGSG